MMSVSTAKKRRVAERASDDGDVDDGPLNLDLSSKIIQDVLSSARALVHAKSMGEGVMPQAQVDSCFLSLLALRDENRRLHLAASKRKDRTMRAKRELDKANLVLQNLLYQQHSASSKIRQCQLYQGEVQVEDLISGEELLERGPPHLKPRDTSDSERWEHEVMLGRLSFEDTERKRLIEELHELTARKEALTSRQSVRHEFLGSLQKHLDNVQKASLPLQKYFSAPASGRSEQRALADALPPPLYVLFSQLHAYQENFGNITTTIAGDLDDACSFNSKHPYRSSCTDASSASNPFVTDASSPSTTSTHPVEDPYVSHPLCVSLTLMGANGATLNFSYLTVLNIVVVDTKPKRMLYNLFPNDEGRLSPNPGNLHVKTVDGPFAFDPESARGCPYKWAQWLCGVEFVPVVEDASSVESLAPSGAAPHARRTHLHVSAVLSRLRDRVEAFASLRKQLESLSARKIPSPPREDGGKAGKSQSLYTWQRVSRKEFEASSSGASSAAAIGDGAWTRYGAEYYRAVFRRSHAQLHALICITPEYPVRSPIFSLSTVSRESSSSSSSSSAKLPSFVKDAATKEALAYAQAKGSPSSVCDNRIKAIESEVNALEVPKELDAWTLSMQLKHVEKAWH